MTYDASNYPWPLGAYHEDYGTVVMVGTTGGEAYRWFDDGDGAVSMIPLSFLLESDEGDES